MKRLSKALVILFTLVALVSVVAVVASADTSNDVATVTIGESVTSYETLKKAYDAVNGDKTDATATITLLKDCAATATDVFKVTRTTGPVVFDLNGKTLNVAAARNQSADMPYIYKSGKYDAGAAAQNVVGKVAYGAISIETDGVTLTVDGNGGKITDSSIATCPIYVLEEVESSTLYVKNVEINTTASNVTYYAPIYVRGGEAYVDNCYVTTNFSGSPAIRQGANAYIEITDSLIEARAAVSSYATAIRIDGTATSAPNGVYVKDSAVIGGSSVFAAHGYDSTSASEKISGVKYGNGYNHRIETKADGTEGPDYVNNNIKFENCVIEQCDYDYKEGDTDCSAVRSTIFSACAYISIDFKDCDITGAWRLFGNASSDTQLTVDGCNLTITGFGDIRMKKSDGTILTGADVTSPPMFVEFSKGMATISNSTFNYDVDGYYGKKINAPVNVDTTYVKYQNNTVDYFQDFDEGKVGSILTVNATPLTVMSDGNGIQRRIKPNGDYESNRTNIVSSLPGGYVGGMIRQGDISIKESSDGNKYLCWDPTVVYNPYNNSQTKADSQIYVKFNGTAYVPATEGEDGAILVNAWKLNGDDVAEYIDVNNDGTADWVDADRSGVAYNGSVKSGAITWEREIPTEYTLNEGMHQGYIGKNLYATNTTSKTARYNVSDVEYFVVDFDYSSGEGSDEFIKMTAAFEGRTSGKEATGSGFTLEANGVLGSKKLVPGKWHHITCVIKLDHEDVTKSVFKAFVDGELAYTRTSGAVNADVIYVDTLRFTVNNSTIYKGNATLCLDNIKETVYPVGYTDAGVEALFEENSQKDLFVWEKSYYMQNACGGVAATVNNQNKTNTTDKDGNPADPWNWYSGDVYTGYATVEAAIKGAKYGDVVTLYADADSIIEVDAPMTVITNGHKFTYYSKNVKATESDGVVTFTAVKPDEFTSEDVEITYTQLSGVFETVNYGKLALGSYAPVDVSKISLEVGFDTENGAYINGVTLNGEAYVTIPQINDVYKYTLATSGVAYGWFIIDSDGEVYHAGTDYSELAALVRASYNLKNDSTIKFYKDYNDYVYESLEFYYSIPNDAKGIFASTTFYIDLNGHTIRVCDSNQNSFIKLSHYMAILETAKEGTTFKDPDGNDVTEYIHIATEAINLSDITLLGDDSSYKEIGGRGEISVYLDSSKPGAVIDNGTGRLFGGAGTGDGLSGMTTNSHKYKLTKKDGTVIRTGEDDRDYFRTAQVYLRVGERYPDNVVKYKANNVANVENSSATLQINNSYLELNGSDLFKSANGNLKIYDSTVHSTSAKGATFNAFFNSTNAVTAVCAYRTNFISDNVDGNVLFGEASLRYQSSNAGLIFEDCNFYNVKVAAKTISTEWNNSAKYTEAYYCGPALEEGEEYTSLKTDKVRILLLGTCTTNMPYGDKTDGRKSSDGLYYPALTNRVTYEAKDLADMEIGLWNNTVTDEKMGKTYEMKYIISDDIDLVDVTFNYADTTETFKYAVGGTAKYELPAYAGKVTERVVTWDKEFGEVTAADTYTATLSYKPAIPVYQNLSLYSNFKYNLYIPTTVGGEDVKNYITSVTLGENEYLPDSFRYVTVGDADYYVFTVENIDSNKTADIINFKVVLTEQNVVGEKSLSVLGYLKTALADENTTEAEYKLCQATLNYTKAAYAQFGGDPTDATRVDELWNTYCKDFKDDDINTAAGTGTVKGLNTAALNLAAAPAFRFTTMSSTADVFTPVSAGNITVTYTYNGNTVTKSTTDGTLVLKNSGEGVDGAYKFYFDIDFRAYEFYQDITVTVGDTVGTYNLANYYNALAAGNELTAELDALVKALNTYARAAAAYKN